MKDVDVLYSDFIIRINTLYNNTIIDYIGDNMFYPADEEAINAEFCCAFVHSALEEFVESICILYLTAMKDMFEQTKIPNISVLSVMMLLSEDWPKTKDGKQIEYEDSFLFVKKCVDKCKEKLHAKLYNNHGVSKEYLLKMLPYVGIDMPDISIVANIDKIASKRGAFAHTFRRVSQKITADEAFEICCDALEFAEVLYKNVKREYNKYIMITKRIKKEFSI